MTNIECTCYKCGHDFDAKEDEFPLSEEGGYELRAVCPRCLTYLGHISVVLTVRE